MRTVVVTPTYDEADNIVELLDRVRSAAPAATVLVVDDGSPDGTADLAEGWGGEHGQVEVLRRTEKAGLGAAYRAGFSWALAAGFEVVAQMDSDLQHDPAELPALLGSVELGADLAIASRYVPGGGTPGRELSRRLTSRIGNRYAAVALGMPVRDATAGFRAYSASALAAVDLDEVRSDGFGFQVEMTYAVVRRGGRVVEVPSTFHERSRGTSKMSADIVVEALGVVTSVAVRDRVVAPLRRRGPRPGGGTPPAGST